MKNRIKFIGFLAVIISMIGILTSACDEIANPYPPKRAVPFTDSIGLDSVEQATAAEAPVQRILLEDYTGHQCGNCPRAAEDAATLKKQYGKRLVTMGVHVGFFARTNDTGKYSEKFSTIDGNAYNTEWGVDNFGLPQGMVNRTYSTSSGSPVITRGQWPVSAQAVAATSPFFDLNVYGIYQKDKRIMNFKTSTKALKAYPNPTKLVAWITEDSIVGWQKDYSLTPPNDNIKNYVHRHVLRTAVNTSWGEDLNTAATNANWTKKSYFGYTLPVAWNGSHCHVVVAIYDATDKHVIQVAEWPSE